MTVVMKFGGTSVADAVCMRQVAEIVGSELPRAPLVVLSAMGKTTDALFRAARAAAGGDERAALAEIETLCARHLRTLADLHDGEPQALRDLLAARRAELDLLLRGVAMLRELTPRTMDAIASHGERLSAAVFTGLLQARGVAATAVDARHVVRTDGRFGGATPDRAAIRALAAERLLPMLGPGRAVVTEGYIGATADGATTTLGRGGSDYSAALLGGALAAEEVQIWTDVEGVLTADPRVVPAAASVPAMTFAEAGELAAFGAKVLHPSTIQPAVESGVPVSVRHTLRPRGGMTQITQSVPGPRPPVTAIANRGPITVLTLTSTRMLHQSGYLARIFDVFGRLRVPVDVIATAEVSVSCTIEADAPVAELVRELESVAQVGVAEQRAIVAVVGEALKRTPGLAARALAALGDVVPELISMGGNDINLSVVVPQALATEAVRRLHRAFFEGPQPGAPR
jgi:aspartate kinase